MEALRGGIPDDLRELDQRPMHDAILDALLAAKNNLPGSRMFKVASLAGAGKTHTCNTTIRSAWENDIILLVCGSSGVAASELNTGKTAHRNLALPFDKDNKPTLEIAEPPTTNRYKKIKKSAWHPH